MFSIEIVGSDIFLDMPTETRELYFHLGMYADDDGFLSPKKIIRMIGASEDNLKLLVAKGFVIPFESGVIVITHWRESNYLRSDRYKPTVHQLEYKKLECIQNVYSMDTIGIPNGYQMDTQDRIGKDRIGKDRLEIDTPPIGESFKTFWNGYRGAADIGKIRNEPARQSLLPLCRKWTPQLEKIYQQRIKEGYTAEEMEKAVRVYCNDIFDRNPEQDYSRHRFSILEFLKQGNAMINFINK